MTQIKCEKLIKITCEVYKWIADKVYQALDEAGVESFHVQSGKNVVIRERNFLSGLFTKVGFEDDPTEIIRFYVHQDDEDRVMKFIIKKAELSFPGRGSIYSQEVTVYHAGIINPTLISENEIADDNTRHLSAFTGIYCIIQRGIGEMIAGSILEMGLGLPTITYGKGGGLRDRLGLLRIAIPSDKEIINLLVSRHDADDVFNYLVDTARLDQPGKGFIYMYPIRKGLVNARLFRGKLKQVASVEQIISAIDDIKGTNEWRRRFSESEILRRSEKRKYIKKMVNSTIYCNEDRITSVINAAMENGAGGATIYELEYKDKNIHSKKILPAREMSDLVIGEAMSESIIKAVAAAGLFEDDCSGIIEIAQVPTACTYISNSKR